jgi:hypothetical protein
VIFIPGDFPTLLVMFTGFVGVVTALIIGGIVAGGAAALGSTAYQVKSAIEGNWPWEDPGDWMLGNIRAGAGGIGQVVESARGMPTIVEQLKGAGGGSSRGFGTGGTLQGATGQAVHQAIERARTPGPEIQSGLQGQMPSAMPMLGGGVGRGGGYASAPSKSDIRKQAWKDIGKGTAMAAGGVALGGVAGGISSALSAVPSFSGVVAGGSSTAPAAAAAVPPSLAAAGPPVAAPTFAQSAMNTVRSGLDPVRQALQFIPETIGDTAYGVLQHAITGAGKGAITNLVSGDDPGIGAATGGVSGAVGAGFSAGASALTPPSQYQFMNSPMPSIAQSGWSPSAPSWASTGVSQLGRPAAGFAGSAVGQAMSPQPMRPREPIYGGRPHYANTWDMGGGPYVQNRPWWSQ